MDGPLFYLACNFAGLALFFIALLGVILWPIARGKACLIAFLSLRIISCGFWFLSMLRYYVDFHPLGEINDILIHLNKLMQLVPIVSYVFLVIAIFQLRSHLQNLTPMKSYFGNPNEPIDAQKVQPQQDNSWE